MISALKKIAIIKKLPLKKTAKKCIIGMELTAATAVPSYLTHSYPLEKVITIGKNIQPHKAISWESAIDSLSKLNREMVLHQQKQSLLVKQRATVARIINEDKNCQLKNNQDRLAYDIVKIAKEYDSDPIAIACIIKKETHFDIKKNSPTGKGAMQLTRLPVKDMFERTSIYDPKLVPIVTAYKTYNNLYEEIQKNPILNIKIGTILFKYYLARANGNVKVALRNYNGTNVKEKYANEVYNDIQKYNRLINKSPY